MANQLWLWALGKLLPIKQTSPYHFTSIEVKEANLITRTIYSQERNTQKVLYSLSQSNLGMVKMGRGLCQPLQLANHDTSRDVRMCVGSWRLHNHHAYCKPTASEGWLRLNVDNTASWKFNIVWVGWRSLWLVMSGLRRGQPSRFEATTWKNS